MADSLECRALLLWGADTSKVKITPYFETHTTNVRT